MLTRKKMAVRLILLLLLLAGMMGVAVSVGSTHIPLITVLESVSARLTHPGEYPASETSTILFSLRMPRIYLAMLVGMALAVAGASFQALLRNPLADPHILGVSSGAALAAILSIAFARRWGIPTSAAAFVGGLITIVLVYTLGSRRGRVSAHTLILAGIIVASFFSSVIIFIQPFLSGGQLRETTFWLTGNFSSVHVASMKWITLVTLATVVLIYRFAGDLNVMLIGEQEAAHLGVPVEWVKRAIFVLAALLTGLAVSLSGSIGFVGLIVPHIARMLFGNDYRLLLPSTAILGAMLTLLADLIARTIVAPTELPVGAITALAGAPVFIYLLRRDRAED